MRSLKLAPFAFLIAMLAPMWLGPAFLPVVAALGGAPEHHCMCGMTRGQCRCPDCAAQEHARSRAERSPLPSIRATCDTDGVAPSPAFAPVALGSARHVVAVAERSRAPVTIVSFDPFARVKARPPTPPPRSARAV